MDIMLSDQSKVRWGAWVERIGMWTVAWRQERLGLMSPPGLLVAV